MSLLVLTTILLHPVFDEPTDVRLVASGLDDVEATWVLDGRVLATTRDLEVAEVHLPAGSYTIEVHAEDDAWRALVRPDPTAAGEARWVPGWSAAVEAPDGGWPSWALPVLLLGAASLLLPWRRPKQP